ncbi:MAG: CarD family transcriptional regulator [Lachnospiraceae bacterium]|nr:CarD family transcriptional regulator [Lachnospiraceae bacterium]MBR4173801.1 CarD family transcriptional regulator [Lachnospiraceae bacterium]
MYQVGDYVVKVNHGVCRVEDIVELEGMTGDKGKRYYLMVPRDDKSSKLYVPVEGKNDNIREVMSADEAEAFIKRIPDIAIAVIESDKLREQEYKAAIRSGSPDKLVSIIKNICRRNIEREEQGKKNTTVDERYFKQAENILFSELAFALDIEKSEMGDHIGEDAFIS